MDELVQREISRRHLFRLGAAGAMSLGAAGFLAACGGGGSGRGGGSTAAAKTIAKAPRGTQLNNSNWPLDIHVDDGKHSTLERLQKEIGGHVKYSDEIND